MKHILFVRTELVAVKRILQLSDYTKGQHQPLQEYKDRKSSLECLLNYLTEQINKPVPQENIHYTQERINEAAAAKAAAETQARSVITTFDLARIGELEKKYQADIEIQLFVDGSGNLIINNMITEFGTSMEFRKLLTKKENNGI